MANDADGKAWIALIVSLAATFAVAGIGSQFMPGEWYEGLNKPSFNPPSAVFGPVWTALYLLMAIAAWLVWRRRKAANVAPALAAYSVQLILNAAWSWLFFGRHQIGLALADIGLLWAAIVATTILYWRLNWKAGALLLPYLAWVSFAAVLNASFWRLNP
jgi:tryptophan-rich sensory protein